jgi:hypothetical protein
MFFHSFEECDAWTNKRTRRRRGSIINTWVWLMTIPSFPSLPFPSLPFPSLPFPSLPPPLFSPKMMYSLGAMTRALSTHSTEFVGKPNSVRKKGKKISLDGEGCSIQLMASVVGQERSRWRPPEENRKFHKQKRRGGKNEGSTLGHERVRTKKLGHRRKRPRAVVVNRC